MKCEILDLDLVNYNFAGCIQSSLLGEVKAGLKEGALILCEFFPVYTLGRNGHDTNLLVSLDFLKKSGIDYCRTERGGDITFHSPGQLVVYPVFNLSFLKKDIDWYLRSLEEVIGGVLLEFGICPRRKDGLTGVWVGAAKIASMGIAISRWVTYHGLSLNVNNDLSYFDFINPCGIRHCRMTSISELRGGSIDMPGLKTKVIEKFKAVFGLKVYAEAYKSAGVA